MLLAICVKSEDSASSKGPSLSNPPHLDYPSKPNSDTQLQPTKMPILPVRTDQKPIYNSTSPKVDEKIVWYGKMINDSRIFGCNWPTDFNVRYKFCFDQHFLKSQMSILPMNYSHIKSFGYGILNEKIMDTLLSCKEDSCDISKDIKQLETQINLWFSHIRGLVEFRQCLKDNVEGIGKLCDSDLRSQTAQVARGMGGLFLNLLDIILDSFATNDDSSSALSSGRVQNVSTCSYKLAEAIHLTSAMYVRTQFYWQNSVLCWDESKFSSNSCKPICRSFSSLLNCLEASCLSNKHLLQFSIWTWFFDPASTARIRCLPPDKKRCENDKITKLTSSEMIDLRNVSTSRKLFDMVRRKYQVLRNHIEERFHVPFYVFVLVVCSMMLVFIILTTLICLWFNGGLGSGKKTVIRYAKVLDSSSGCSAGGNKYRVDVDETRSLTRDCEDIE
uniref:Uncharacterized protein n=1 Tax=Romanomermis culicivorax TaxID=13658 RepID=A0A915JG29_ROMCU